MRNTVLFATGNTDKAAELAAILSEYDIITLKDIGFTDDIDENGTTFEENALIKARAAHKASGYVCVADDSGICVDALGGDPGIHSARYSGGDYHDNNIKLVSELKDVPYEKRTARFVSAAAVVFPSGEEYAVRGEVEGHVLFAEAGSGGFGYDPLFYCDEAEKSYAEMNEDEKNAISHRKRAFEKLKHILKDYFDKKN